MRFTRDVANITMDLNDVEHIDFTARGGADNISIHNLSGTDVTQVNIDLGAAGGGGDTQADQVTLDATNGNDVIEVVGAGTSVAVLGLSAQVNITNVEGIDHLTINGFGGDDTITASTLPAGTLALTIDGGAGNDTLIGSQGADVLIGGDGNDTVTGGRGDDLALLGAGDDRFIWNPGEGSDTVEGQAGVDTLDFFGSNANENIDIAANGERVRFFRDVANVTMDLNDVERIHFTALGGADSIVVNDLTGTDVTQVAIDLAGPADPNAGDGQQDRVTVAGTAGADTIKISESGNAVVVHGLSAEVSIEHADAAGDVLAIAAGAGDDTIDASGLSAGKIGLQLLGGDGKDVLIGSAGDDLIAGGRGDDVALMGAGDDTFTWAPGEGSDTVEGQGGVDTLAFNGANVGETIDISANGGRVLFHRDVASITHGPERRRAHRLRRAGRYGHRGGARFERHRREPGERRSGGERGRR